MAQAKESVRRPGKPVSSQQRWTAAGIVAIVLVVVGAGLALAYLAGQRDTKHEAPRWAVIQDDHGSRMAVETPSEEVWGNLVAMNAEGRAMWVGGIVEPYDNTWGFRFRPDSLNVSEVTAEGLQAWIRAIAEDLDYWLGGYGYVWATVAETHTA